MVFTRQAKFGYWVKSLVPMYNFWEKVHCEIPAISGRVKPKEVSIDQHLKQASIVTRFTEL